MMGERERVDALREALNQAMPLLAEMSVRAERIVCKRDQILDRSKVFCFPSHVIAGIVMDGEVEVTIDTSCGTDSRFVLLDELFEKEGNDGI